MKVLVRVIGTVLLLWLIFSRVNFSHLLNSFSSMNPLYWLGAFGLLVFTQVLSSQRWRILARAVGFEGGLGLYISYFFIGMFFNLALPTSVGGDVVRAWYLGYRSPGGPVQNRRSKAFLTVFSDRFSGVLVLVAIAVIATWASPTELPAWMKGTVYLIGAGAVASFAFLPLIAKFGDRFTKIKVVLNSAKLCFGNIGVLASTTAMSMWVQFANISIMVLVGMGLGLDIPVPYYFVMVPLVTLMTMLPISLGGMGLREGATVLMLTPLGIEPATAVALSLLNFSVYVVCGLLGVFFYLGARANPGALASSEQYSNNDQFSNNEEASDGNPFSDHSGQRRAG